MEIERIVLSPPSPGLDMGAGYDLKLVLESAGSSLGRLVQVRAMIYDRIEYDALNRVYRQYVPEGPPARTVWSVRIMDAFKVQLDAIAVI